MNGHQVGRVAETRGGIDSHSRAVYISGSRPRIANASIMGRLRRLVAAEGFALPEIYTPEELSGDQDE